MSNIKTINLADHINAAIDKINENFVEVMANAGLTEAEVIALILSEISKINDDTGFTESEIRAFLASTTLDLGSNKILYSNVFPNESDLPDASAYHGMFAHVHNTGAAYFAHAGSWVKLANASDLESLGSLDNLNDVDTSGKTIGQVLKWNGSIWIADDESGSGGGGGGTSVYTVTVYARSPKGAIPTKPNNGSYKFSTGVFVEPTSPNWYRSIPTTPSSDDVWASTTTFITLDPDTTVNAGTWSDPSLVGSQATPVDNSAGSKYAQVFAYKRVASDTTLGASDAPVGGSFDFSTGIYLSPDEEQINVSVDAGWESTPPSRTDLTPQLYVVTGIASDVDLDDGVTIDTAITWGDPRPTSSGTDGQDGKSTFLAVAYRRVPDTADSNNDLVVPDAPRGGGIDFGATTPSGVHLGFPITDASGNQWYSTPPAGTDTLWQSYHLFTQFGDTGQDWATDDRTSTGTPLDWSEPSIQSIIPVSTYFKSLYARSHLDLTQAAYILPDPADNANNGAVYDFTLNRFTSLPSHNGITWTEEMPPLFDGNGDSNGPLWEISTVATLRGAIGADNTLSFTLPKLILNVAIDGIDGYQVTQLNAYRRAGSWTTSTPVSGGSFNFATKEFTTPANWSKTVPTGDSQLYVITGVASTRPDNYPTTTTPLEVDSQIEWDLPEATQSGGNGAPGRSTALVVAVTRTPTASAPNTPTGGSVNFTGGITKVMPTATDHTWYDDVGLMDAAGYNVGGTIWASEATFSISGDEGTDNTATWSAPYLDHNNGADGFSTYQVQIFKRDSSTATVNSITGTLPTNNDPSVYYDFDNDGMFGLPSDWSETPQENRALGNALWMSRAAATVQGDLQGTDNSLTWTSPVIYSVDGDSGTPDLDSLPRESRGYVYYYTTIEAEQNTLAASLQPSYNATLGFTWDDSDGGSITGLNGNWGMNPTVDTNLSGTLWAARYFAERSNEGVTTVTVSSAFRSYNFNGLVTFQNMNQELGDRFSASVTTIDGGKIETGSLKAESLVTDSLTVKSLKGNVNIITPFAGSGYRTWGPTKVNNVDTYKHLTTINLPRNTVVRNVDGTQTETIDIPHMATINMAFSGVFATDTAYVKLEMRKRSDKTSNGSFLGWETIQIMTHKTGGGGNAWTTIPVIGSYKDPVDVDVEFKISVLMRGDTGGGSTNQSRSSNNSWSGTVAGLVASTNIDPASGSGTQDDTGSTPVTGVDEEGNALDDTAIWNEYSSDITAATSTFLSTIDWESIVDSVNDGNSSTSPTFPLV